MLEGLSFEELHGTVNVLVADSDQQVAPWIGKMLGAVPVYRVISAVNVDEVHAVFRAAERIHVAVFELGMEDTDDFCLLRQYAAVCPSIVYTGSGSSEKGAQSVRMGAREVVDKQYPPDPGRLMSALNRCALISLVNRAYSDCSGGTMNNATRVLLKDNPGSVTQWAEALGISDRQLRSVWASGTQRGAKQVLFVHQLFRAAFIYYRRRNRGEEISADEAAGFGRLRDYYRQHRELIESFLG